NSGPGRLHRYTDPLPDLHRLAQRAACGGRVRMCSVEKDSTFAEIGEGGHEVGPDGSRCLPQTPARVGDLAVVSTRQTDIDNRCQHLCGSPGSAVTLRATHREPGFGGPALLQAKS